MNNALIASFVSELIKISQQPNNLSSKSSWTEITEPVRFKGPGGQTMRAIVHDRRKVQIPTRTTTPPVAQKTAPAPTPKIDFARPGASKFQPIGEAGGRPQVAPNLAAKGRTGQPLQPMKPITLKSKAPKFNAERFQKTMANVRSTPTMQNIMKTPQ